MRQTSLLALLCLALLGVLAPDAEANKFKPKSGSKIRIKQGKSAKIKVQGFQGCKMEAFPMIKDSDVAEATSNATDKAVKSPTITVQAMKAGSTDLFIDVFSDNKFCNVGGSFTIIVDPDTKAFEKQAKAKMKQMKKDVKTDLNQAIKELCEGFDGLEELFDSEASGAIVIQELFPEVEAYAWRLEGIVQDRLQETYEDIWGRADKEFGLTEVTPDLVGLLDGGCGDWDKCVASTLKMSEGAAKKAFKKYKSFVKKIDKTFGDEDGDALITTDPLVATPKIDVPIVVPAEVPGDPPDPQPKSIEKQWSASGRMSNDPTGRLRIGGTAEPGADVTVTIKGPAGFMASTAAPVDGDDCTFSADFAGLKPGSYTVSMTRGDETVTFTRAVP